LGQHISIDVHLEFMGAIRQFAWRKPPRCFKINECAVVIDLIDTPNDAIGLDWKLAPDVLIAIFGGFVNGLAQKLDQLVLHKFGTGFYLGPVGLEQTTGDISDVYFSGPVTLVSIDGLQECV